MERELGTQRCSIVDNPPCFLRGQLIPSDFRNILGSPLFHTAILWSETVLLPSPTPTPPWIIPALKKNHPTSSLVGDDCGYIWLCVWNLPDSRKPGFCGLVTSFQMSRNAAIREEGMGLLGE